jgi:hypothetical protein
MRFVLASAALAAACLAVPSVSFADSFYASTDRFGYSGTVTRYATLADAKAGTNSLGSYNSGQRDFSVFVTKGSTGAWGNSTIAATAWSYTTSTAGLGWGNPSNTNDGFVQMYDQDSDTVTSRSGRWTSSAHDTFELSLSGINAGSAEYARLWNAPSSGGKAGNTAGVFLEYSLNLLASGLNGQDLDNDGFVESTDHPDAVAGSFKGIFENLSTTDPASNGFYVFDFGLNMTNWAYDNQASLNGAFARSEFGAAAVVPIPAAAVAGFALLGGIGAFRRVRRQA